MLEVITHKLPNSHLHSLDLKFKMQSANVCYCKICKKGNKGLIECTKTNSLAASFKDKKDDHQFCFKIKMLYIFIGSYQYFNTIKSIPMIS